MAETTGKVSALTFLTEREKDAVEMFIQNEAMREGVRKVLMDGASGMGVQIAGMPSLMTRNWVFGLDKSGMMSDDAFGRAIRVHTEAIILVEQSFDKMKELIPTPEEKAGKNKAL